MRIRGKNINMSVNKTLQSFKKKILPLLRFFLNDIVIVFIHVIKKSEQSNSWKVNMRSIIDTLKVKKKKQKIFK